MRPPLQMCIRRETRPEPAPRSCAHGVAAKYQLLVNNFNGARHVNLKSMSVDKLVSLKRLRSL